MAKICLALSFAYLGELIMVKYNIIEECSEKQFGCQLNWVVTLFETLFNNNRSNSMCLSIKVVLKLSLAVIDKYSASKNQSQKTFIAQKEPFNERFLMGQPPFVHFSSFRMIQSQSRRRARWPLNHPQVNIICSIGNHRVKH